MADTIVIRVEPPMGDHRRLRVFIGPDRDHVVLAGVLTMRGHQVVGFAAEFATAEVIWEDSPDAAVVN